MSTTTTSVWHRSFIAIAVIAFAAGCSSDGDDDALTEDSTAATADDAAVTTQAQDVPTEDADEAAVTTEAQEDGPGDGSGGSADMTSYIGDPDPSMCEAGGQDSYTLGYATFSDTDNFTRIMNDGLAEVAQEVGCVEIETLVDNADPVAAVQNAEVLAQQEVDGAMLLNVVAAAAPGQDRVFDDADIPTISLLIPLPGEAFVHVDETAAGTQAGEAAVAAFQERFPDAPAPYAIIGRWDQSGENGIARMDAVEAAVEAGIDGIEILQVDTAGDAPTAQAGALGVLSSIPDDANILLVANNDDLTFAMFKALQQEGRTDSSVAVGIGGGGDTAFGYSCQDEAWAGTVAFFPENWAEFLIPGLIAVINGAEFEESLVLPTEFIGRDEITDHYPDFSCES